MRLSRLSLSLVALVVVGTTACAGEDEGADADVGASDEAMTTTRGIHELEMKPVPIPAGFPKAWSQPDSDGWFDERGKCGPTAVANALLLYGRDGVSPNLAYEEGVQWVVGSRPIDLERYLDREQADLRCSVVYPEDGPAFLRAAVASGRPVMTWFRTEGLTSHWVTVAGIRGANVSEKVVVMSWGRYYEIPMYRFAEAWKSVYGFHNPAVACAATTARVGKKPF